MAIMFSACGGQIPAPDQFKPEAARYHTALQRRSEIIKSLSGELAVELWDSGKRVAIRQLFASRPPYQLRMDTLSPFEQPLATLIYHDNLLAIHDIEQSRFAVGAASAQNFERLTRVRIKPAEMSALLSGQVPRILKTGGVVRWDSDRGKALLTLEARDERQLIFFDESNLTPRVVEIYRENELLLRLSLAKYTDQEPYLPQRLRFELPSEKIRVEIELKDFTLNPDLPDIAFEIKAPPGLSMSDL
jgi:outer membrane lipoprotein-sorting protein